MLRFASSHPPSHERAPSIAATGAAALAGAAAELPDARAPRGLRHHPAAAAHRAPAPRAPVPAAAPRAAAMWPRAPAAQLGSGTVASGGAAHRLEAVRTLGRLTDIPSVHDSMAGLARARAFPRRELERHGFTTRELTGTGVPAMIVKAINHAPRPSVVQAITNLLDSAGGIKQFAEDDAPRTTIAEAVKNGVGVLGIRAVQAGALTGAIDRPLSPNHPESRDYQRAAP